MIQANELRIGNWVFFDDTKPKKIQRISHSSVSEGNDRFSGMTRKFIDIKPIPLTPEILEKFGFEYWTLDHDCTDPNDAYWVHPKLKFAINNIKWTVQKLDVQVKYIHQLQNLYFALTGEELNINL